MKARSAETTGGMIRILIMINCERHGSALLQGEEVKNKSQGCARLQVFGTDRRTPCPSLSITGKPQRDTVLRYMTCLMKNLTSDWKT
jgi:hypothetical protein